MKAFGGKNYCYNCLKGINKLVLKSINTGCFGDLLWE